jgi:hypothetical protein
MPYQTLPRRYPADRIKSGEWNVILDNVDYHETRINQAYDVLANHESRITTLEQIATQPIVIIGFGEAGYVISAGSYEEHQPFSSAKGSSKGMPIPTDLTVKKFMVYINSNSLDGDTIVAIRKNEVEIETSKITIPAGQTGLFSIELSEDFVEGDRLDFIVDATSSTTGEIDISGMSVKASIPPPAYY